jgi:hypothetical protein
VVVCTGSEWYYFPSHFFLPPSARLEFISDGFHGQLPHHFSKFHGTSATPALPFNDDNMEDVQAYVDVSRCDYLVTLSRPDRLSSIWPAFQRMSSEKVLHIEQSVSSIARALFIPFYSSKRNVYRKYLFYKRKASHDSAVET